MTVVFMLDRLPKEKHQEVIDLLKASKLQAIKKLYLEYKVTHCSISCTESVIREWTHYAIENKIFVGDE